ncbi:MAG: FHA domain-containing protein, partial [Mycobacterium sp.]
MSAPVLTVRYNGAPSSFAPGHDVVVGRDLRADIRIPHPLISRAHVVLRFDSSVPGGRWTAIDNGSLNGMYVNGRRVPAVDIADGSVIALGNPDGPVLQFETGRHQGAVGRPPQTSTVLIPPPPQPSYAPPSVPSYQPPPFPPYAPPTRPTAPAPTPGLREPGREPGRADAAPTQMSPAQARPGS